MRHIILPPGDPHRILAILHAHAQDMARGRLGAYDPDEDPVNVFRRLQSGGFTLHDHTGRLPTTGYMVSVFGREQPRPISMMSPDDIIDYQRRYSSDLAKPGHHLGGWLAPHGNEMWGYLDVSRHHPQITPAIEAAARNGQLGIYDLSGGKSVMPSGGTWLQGSRPAASRSALSAATGSSVGSTWYSDRSAIASMLLPEHDWSQHSLGDPEDWHLASHRYAQPVGPLQNIGPAGGTHGATVQKDKNGQEWVIKPTPPGKDYLAHGEAAANKIGQLSGLNVPDTFVYDTGKGIASAQKRMPGADAFTSGFDPDSLSDSDLLDIQRHHALDWLVSNHDSHPGQFIRTADGHLVGVDKGQAYKHFGQDRLHWNFHPNSHYSENEPVYNTIYRNFARGGREVFDPRQGELGAYLQKLQSIPDDQFQALLKPYAEGAAQAGELATPNPFSYSGFKQPQIPPNDVASFLAAATARKNSLTDKFGRLYDNALAHRTTGLKVAQQSPTLQQLHDDFKQWHGLGYKNGLQFWGNIEEYLSDRHGLHPPYGSQAAIDAYFSHPVTVGMAKLHSMSQGKHWVDGAEDQGPIPDDDLLQGAALGLLKIRRQHQQKTAKGQHELHLLDDPHLYDYEIEDAHSWLLHHPEPTERDEEQPHHPKHLKVPRKHHKPQHFRDPAQEWYWPVTAHRYADWDQGRSSGWVALPEGGWQHSSGDAQVRPSDTHPGHYQLWDRTVRGQGHWAPIKAPSVNPEHLMNWADWSAGRLHRPKAAAILEGAESGHKACVAQEASAALGTFRLAAPPDPDQLQYVGQPPGGTHGAQIWSDPQGEWLFKKPDPGNEFMVPLDFATSQLQQEVGLDTPEIHAMPHEGGLATAAKWIPGTQAWKKSPHLNELSPQDQLTLQKHHALDWLIANHDAHVGNFLRTPEGGLVGIDKGQALKYFGRDKLHWDFHPNYYAREPIYNQLWRDHARGHGQMLDPRQGELGEFVKSLQNIPDDKLRSMFTPYATSAAQTGLLATGDHQNDMRGLTPPTVEPNNPQAFLDALVARKHNLMNDLGSYYDAATHQRDTAPLTPEWDPQAFASEYNAIIPHSGSSVASGYASPHKARSKIEQLMATYPGTPQTQQLQKLHTKYFGGS